MENIKIQNVTAQNKNKIHKATTFHFFKRNRTKHETFLRQANKFNSSTTSNTEPRTSSQPRVSFIAYWQGGSTVVIGYSRLDITATREEFKQWIELTNTWFKLWGYFAAYYVQAVPTLQYAGL